MGTSIRVLIVEDSQDDTLLEVHELRRSGYDPIFERVETVQAFSAALAQRTWDIVIADYSMPHFDGLAALRLVRESGLDLPFILVSGAIGEETAVVAMKAGAHDYVMKDNLARLGPAVRRELHEAQVRLARQQAEKALQESEEKYRLLVDNAQEAIIVAQDGILKFFNPKALEFAGYSRQETASMPFAEMIHPDDREMALQYYLKCLRGEESPPLYQVRLIDKFGNIKWLESNVVLVTWEGRPATLNFLSNITERRWAEEALRQYAAELEARNEDLDAFAHTVAHDLKGPLGHMVGFAEVLEQDYTTLPQEEVHRHLHTIARSGRKMSSIVDALLLLAEARKMKVAMQPLNMAGIVAEALGRLTAMLEKCQAQIVLPDTWPMAQGYDLWVEEVWVNYLSNALKFGGRPPRVELGGAVQTENGSATASPTVRFWVCDNGPGLTPEDQERLFTPFTQLEQVSGRGHGLGLSIVRRIVEKMGGHVGVQSEIGVGSTFWFTLPA